MLISDCRVLVDGGARDAVWGAVAHLVSAFSSSGAQQRRHLSNAAGHEARGCRGRRLQLLYAGGGGAARGPSRGQRAASAGHVLCSCRVCLHLH